LPSWSLGAGVAWVGWVAGARTGGDRSLAVDERLQAAIRGTAIRISHWDSRSLIVSSLLRIEQQIVAYADIFIFM
jgi:hypothetical protein